MTKESTGGVYYLLWDEKKLQELFTETMSTKSTMSTKLAEEERSIIIYESTYRIEKLISELAEYMPGRIIVVCRELTKKFEEAWRGTPEQILSDITSKTIKGEFVIVIAPKNWKEPV